MAVLERIDDHISDYALDTSDGYIGDAVSPKDLAIAVIHDTHSTGEQKLRAWAWLKQNGYIKQATKAITQAANNIRFAQNVIPNSQVALVSRAMVSPAGQLVHAYSGSPSSFSAIGDQASDTVAAAGGAAAALNTLGAGSKLLTDALSGNVVGLFSDVISAVAGAFSNPYASPAGDDPARPGRSLGDARTWLEQLGAIYPAQVKSIPGVDGQYDESIIWINPKVLKWLYNQKIIDQNIAQQAPGGVFGSLDGKIFYVHSQPTDIQIKQGDGVYNIAFTGLPSASQESVGYAMTVFDDGTIRFDAVTPPGQPLPANGASYFHAGISPVVSAGTVFTGTYGQVYQKAIQAAVQAAQYSLAGLAPFSIDPAAGDSPLSIQDVFFAYTGASGGAPDITQTTTDASNAANQASNAANQTGVHTGSSGAQYTTAQILAMIQSGNVPPDVLKLIQANPQWAALYTQYTGKNINQSVVKQNSTMATVKKYGPWVVGGGIGLWILKKLFV